jgi:hypothetical protein
MDTALSAEFRDWDGQTELDDATLLMLSIPERLIYSNTMAANEHSMARRMRDLCIAKFGEETRALFSFMDDDGEEDVDTTPGA